MPHYELLVESDVHKLRKHLPGSMRQRIKRAIDELACDPRPAQSQPLDTTDLEVPQNVEIRRLRLQPWRIIYGVNDTEGWVWILAVRQRPPYDYNDLDELITSLK